MNEQSSFELFLGEAGRLARASHEVLARPRTPESLHEAIGALVAIELDARTVGVTDLADLTGALRKSLERREAPAEALRDAQLAAATTLVDAIEELRAPDRSGAHLDADRVAQAIGLLRGSRPSQPAVARPTSARPAGRPPALASAPGSAAAPGPAQAESAPTADDTRWEPTVDEDMIDPFLEECGERLDGLAERLVELERSPGDAEIVRAIFRDLHTLKGSSAFVGLKRMTKLAHAAEDIVGLVRDGKRTADRPLVDALLASLDVLRAIVQRASARAAIDVDISTALSLLSGKPTAATVAPRHTTTPDGGTVAVVSRAAEAQAKQTLRIDFEKLDLLMNLVGELVLAKGHLAVGVDGLGALGRELEAQRRNAASRATRDVQAAGSRLGGVRTQDVATELGRIFRAFASLSSDLEVARNQIDFAAGELRDQVMKLRMVPIGRSWSKFHRTVREIAHGLGKQVRLELRGAETELDKVLVEQLDDPFLHLVRNAIDHGIEAPEARAAAGKSSEGMLRLGAHHRGNQIVITVEDDGAGIDTERVRRKAVEKGLVDAASAEALDQAQIYELLFRPGFSTAQKVSDLSGRGVGMDVVKETISRLKGTVSVDSTLGKGSRFEIRLPLTLAIIQVLLVRCAGELFALPIDLVARTVAVAPDAIRLVCDREVLHDAGREVPLVRLRDVLELADPTSTPRNDVPIVLVDVGGQTYGLVCDGLVGRQEIVIKSLGTLLVNVPGAAGATIVGDRCVLILDVPTVAAMALAAPAGRPRASHNSAPTSRLPATARRQRILVAEDAEIIRETIRRTLENAGYDVVACVDGVEALARATAEEFDLVSTDVVMPNMDGYELTRRLRETARYRDVPIIMVTSKSERVDQIRGFDAGVDAYLAKPTDAVELLRVIARYLPRPGSEPPA